MVTESDDPIEDASFILLFGLYWPGIGQVLQRRIVPGILFGVGAAILVVGALLSSRYQIALWSSAVLLTLWSVLDIIVAARRARRARERAS
jgi:hypothetical protein